MVHAPYNEISFTITIEISNRVQGTIYSVVCFLGKAAITFVQQNRDFAGVVIIVVAARYDDIGVTITIEIINRNRLDICSNDILLLGGKAAITVVH